MKMMVVITKMNKVTDEVMKMVKRIKTVTVMKMLRKRIVSEDTDEEEQDGDTDHDNGSSYKYIPQPL